MDPGQPARVWTFAGCRLDERSLELEVQGNVVELDRKPLEVLLHLLRHAGEVVTKDELAEAVWPGRIITDSNLTKTVAVVRAALGEAGPDAIKTVHGYGYRLVAVVSVQVPTQEAPPARLDLKAGDHPPLRPDWVLATRIGAGGQSEVWLAHHAQTREARVFKFADAERSLTSLKREVTLNRLLAETLPDRTDLVRLLDWNVEVPPFFVECEYIPSGNLVAWAERQGGWRAVPLATRIGLVAQIADALSAAHSVGVLHKDLKPSNVLVHEIDGQPRIKLADFGSGTVVDTGALEAHRITRMGFTQAVQPGTTSGTPIYLAPEVIAGQAFTVKSDVYSLGVMLYQLAAGDTQRPLAPGWEKEIADELLREDIGAAVAGDPADRLADASALAQRLRGLDARRAARVEAARMAQSKVKLRRLRLVAGALAIVVAGVSVAALAVWRARERALQAETTALAVNRFLIDDILGAASPERSPVADLKVLDVLDQSAALVDQRLAGQPAVAAQVHMSLGQTYDQLREFKQARHHYERAATLFEAVDGADAVSTLQARLRQGTQIVRFGDIEQGCAMVATAAASLEERLDPHSEAGLEFRARAIRGCARTSEQSQQIIPLVEAVIAELEQRGLTDRPAYRMALERLGSLVLEIFDYERGLQVWDKVVEHSAQRYGPQHFATSRARILRTESLLNLGRLAEADAELAQASANLEKWAGGRGALDIKYVYLAVLRIEQGRFEEAERVAREDLPGYRNIMLQVRAEASLQLGRDDAVIELVRQNIELSREKGSPPRFYEMLARPFWVDVLLRRGRVQEAREVLGAVSAAEVAEAQKMSGTWAEWRRSEGLVLMAEGKRAEGCTALRDALDFFEQRYAEKTWRWKRAKAEYALCSPDAALQQ